MNVNEAKFERNSSQEYDHMTCIAKTKHTSERGLLDLGPVYMEWGTPV